MRVTDDLPSLLRIAPSDDVAVTLRAVSAGEHLTVTGLPSVHVAQDVPKGHKLALRDMPAGCRVQKFGSAIGVLTAAVRCGDWVHSHNLRTALAGQIDYRGMATAASADWSPPASVLHSFQGFRRADGRVGTRNEIWVLATVGCVARTARRIAEAAQAAHAGVVDGVYAYTHPFGCSQLGDDLARTQAIIAGLARHPNVGGLLLVGLGCESLQLSRLLPELELQRGARIRAFTAQQSEDEVAEGLDRIAELVALMRADVREPCPLSELVLGLKCGGSDGFSGLTANPLVGAVADRVAAAGGTPVLTEIPEIFGAEHLLMQRATTPAIADQVAALVNDFKQYFLDHGEPVSENPSPGNIAGGITTLEEKSLGAVQKSGRAPLTQVLRYGESVRAHGLALLEAPGNDAVSSTALVAAGVTVLLFTTGRGTPLGFPAPTLKIASNSALARSKPRWIDFDAGRLLSGMALDTLADELLALVIATASGQATQAEHNGERDIAIWKGGVTL